MKSNKGFAPIIVILGVVIVLAAAGGYWWWQNKAKVVSPITQQSNQQLGSQQITQPTLTPTQQESQYKNNLLGYEITYKQPWRIAEDYTEQLYLTQKLIIMSNLTGCSLDSATLVDKTKFYLCVQNKAKNNPDLLNKVNYLDSLLPYPGSEKSDLVAFTDLNENAEKALLKAFLADKSKTILDFPEEHLIIIYPFGLEPFFGNHEPDTKIKLRLKIIQLQNGAKAELDDSRLAFSSGRLKIFIPYQSPYKVFLLPDEPATTTKSLVIDTGAAENSDTEKALYDILNSLKFK